MPLPGPTRQAISEALLDAFDKESLEQLVFYRLSDRLDRISGGGTLPKIVYDLISKSEQEGWTPKLVSAARDERPASSLVAIAAEALRLAAATPARRQLERMISEAAGMLDPVSWRGRLAQIESQVCRIEIPVVGGRVRGTGVLVGPDEVLTNQHVIARLAEGTADVARVRLRFDYKRMEDGVEVNPGTEYELDADDWLIASAPPSELDDLADTGGRDPDSGELDYALLRLAERVGEQPVGTNASPGAPRRDWVDLAGAAVPEIGSPLFIMQHPAGEPVKLAIDSVIGVNDNKTRIRYRANTEAGSSGSPCFDIDLNWVALHHSGDPDFDPDHKPEYNEGVPADAIAADIESAR